MRLNNPLSSPIRGPVHDMFTDMLRYPDGTILYYDADTDAYTEQTDGPHTFNHATLPPQYQRNSDGSYTNVGANPAVDSFDGEKWLRSCGAVTNLLPRGAEDILAWYKRGTVQVAAFSDGANLITGVNTGNNDFFIVAFTSVSVPLTPAISIKKVSASGVLLFLNPVSGDSGAWKIDLSLLGDGFEDIHSAHPAVTAVVPHISTGSGGGGLHFRAESGGPLSFYVRNPQLTATSYPVPYTPPGTTMPASNATTTNGCWFTLADGSPVWKALDGEIQAQNLITNGSFDTNIDGWNVYEPTAAILSWNNGKLRIQNNGVTYGAAHQAFSTVVGDTYEVSVDLTVIAGAPARAAVANTPGILVGIPINTSTSGTYKFRFTATRTTSYILLGNRDDRDAYNEFDNISIQRIQPKPLTLATRIRMGVGSEDWLTGVSIYPYYVSQSAGGYLQYSFLNGPRVHAVTSYDGSASANTLPTTWSRNSVIRRVTQVSADGTQFRVGYMIEGTHTTIQWSVWTAYDGSFDPSTLYRLMLGYNNPYPMWFNKIAVWNKQMDDAAILEALN